MKIFRNVPWLPFGWDGMAVRPFIFLKAGHDHLLTHEAVHLRQQREHGIAYYFKYAFSKSFRARMEIEAYRADGLSEVDIYNKLTRFYGIESQDAWMRLK